MFNESNIFIVDGEVSRNVSATASDSYPTVEDGNMEWYVYEDSAKAGETARERWEDMANNDPKEFVAMIGEERLVKWALGHSDGYGISSLEQFLDKVAENPEEELASYDGSECDAKCNVTLLEELELSSLWNPGMSMDYDMLRKDLEDCDLDAEDLAAAFPEGEGELVTMFVEDPTDKNWADVRKVIERDLDAGEFWVDELWRNYTFVDVVAYRHN